MAKDNEWLLDLEWLDDIDNDLREGMQDVVESAANKGLEIAQDFVPNLKKSRGYATGALSLSGYVISRRGSGYSQAIAAAKVAPKTRIGIRNQIEPEFPIQLMDVGNPNFALAILDFPTTYARLIQMGFHHRGAKRYIIGVDFINSTMNRVEPMMMREASKMVKQVVDRPRPVRLKPFTG